MPRGVTARPEGKALKGLNPMSAEGMKQGHRGCGGASRQEGEEPCRRNVPGEASPGHYRRSRFLCVL
jgi:hypothetical protein